MAGYEYGDNESAIEQCKRLGIFKETTTTDNKDMKECDYIKCPKYADGSTHIRKGLCTDYFWKECEDIENCEFKLKFKLTQANKLINLLAKAYDESAHFEPIGVEATIQEFKERLNG